ncbi:transposase [Constrictibacter sp. MBR-5]|uniref:transposase n=1 Tax=Constrictibacter sp. MBR-5 TaxID=3156467 RepID=UPI0033929D9E
MHLGRYFEGTASERGIEWRCADSLSLREFLRIGRTERVPDHSWPSRTRARLPVEVHPAVFSWILKHLSEHGLLRGGGSASTSRPWRPVPPRARSCAGRVARRTARCWSAWRCRAASRRRVPRTSSVSTARARARSSPTKTGRARPRSGHADRAHEERHDAPRQQAGSRGGPGHRRDQTWRSVG